MWFFFPNTKGMPLEEVAALFGDADEVRARFCPFSIHLLSDQLLSARIQVAIYQRDINVDVDDAAAFGVERKPGAADTEEVERVAETTK